MERMNLDTDCLPSGLPCFDGCPDSGRSYGGMAGVKRGVLIDGQAYMIKYPDNLKAKHIKNADTYYGNNPIAEHIGSRLYVSFGVPAHETILGTRNGKLVVACKDFTYPTTKLTEMREIMVSSAEDIMDEVDPSELATTRDLEMYVRCLREWRTPFPQLVGLLEFRLWLMLVADAVIGNPDRNNGNWGVCTDKVTGMSVIAPVYDNGNSLNFRLSERQVEELLSNEAAFHRVAVGDVRSWFEHQGHTINIFKFLKNPSAYREELRAAIGTILVSCDADDVYEIIDGVIPLSPVRKEFYFRLIQTRIKALANFM